MASFLVKFISGDQKLVSSEKKKLRIGRLPVCEIFLDENVVSRRHAEVYSINSKYHVHDTGSRNGTMVNGKRITQPTELSPGDIIGVGSAEIVYEPSKNIALDIDRDFAETTIMMSLPATPSFEESMAPQGFLETVADISSQIAQNRPLEGLLDFILNLCLDKTDAERAAILLMDENSNLVPRAYLSQAKTHPQFVISRSIAKKAIEENKAILIKDVAHDENLKRRESVIGLEISSAICTPMWDGDQTIGILYIDTSKPDRKFSEMDLLFFSTLSGMVAEKIKNAILNDIAKDKQRLDGELKIAREIQSRLFPLTIQQIKGYDLSAFNRPCTEVCGDYFDIIETGETYGIAIGDVAGKGVGPAMLMSNLQAILRTRALEFSDPAALLIKMNADLIGRVGDDRFITFFYLVLQPRQGQLIYANAGHSPPLLWRYPGEVSTLKVSGVPLGIFEESMYETFSIELGSGDVLLLYSDGITECFNKTGDLFGENRLKNVLAKSAHADAQGIRDTILSELDHFRQDEPYSDDVTLVVLKRP